MAKLISLFYLGHNLIREVFESHRGGLRLDGLVVKSLLYMCVHAYSHAKFMKFSFEVLMCILFMFNLRCRFQGIFKFHIRIWSFGSNAWHPPSLCWESMEPFCFTIMCLQHSFGVASIYFHSPYCIFFPSLDCHLKWSTSWAKERNWSNINSPFVQGYCFVP